jgi:hypothetical protein
MAQLEKGLLDIHNRPGMDGDDKAILLDAAQMVAWDDAIHIAAPWEPRSSLCGNWFRNLITLDEPQVCPGNGCWTCWMAAEWLAKQKTVGAA